MKEERYDGTKARMILTGMVVSTRVLSRVAPKWRAEGLFNSKWENTVAGWCVDYLKRYKKAPAKRVEGLFRVWAEDQHDKDGVRLVERFLSGLSGEYDKARKKINPEYVVDQAGAYFNEVALRKLRDTLDGDLDQGDVKRALGRLHKFAPVDVGRQALVKLTDKNLWEEVLADPPKPLVQYDGALGRFFGRSLRRGKFVVIMAPMKRAKSYFTFDLGWRAMLQRNRVLYVQLGDMSRNDEMERVACRVTGAPLVPGEVKFVKGMKWNGSEVSVKTKGVVFKTGLTPKKVREAVNRMQDQMVGSKRSFIRFSYHPMRSCGMGDVRSIVDELVHEGWIPDVICLDYLDILAPPSGFHEDHRAGVNDNWMNARRLAQELNCLMVSNTQANAASFTADSLGMKHFSEDNRKFAHVDGMVGLNQKTDEKEVGLWRLNWIVLRGEKFSVTRHCYVAGDLAVSNPTMRSLTPK
jgi:hypothetical protein